MSISQNTEPAHTEDGIEALSLFASKEKKKCTLPTQALPCSGSKGLSQSVQPASYAKTYQMLTTDTPGAFLMSIYA